MTFVASITYQQCDMCGKRTMWTELQDEEQHKLLMCRPCLNRQTTEILECQVED